MIDPRDISELITALEGVATDTRRMLDAPGQLPVLFAGQQLGACEKAIREATKMLRQCREKGVAP